MERDRVAAGTTPADEALRLREERLRAAMNASADGFWDRDLRAGRVFHSARMNEMVGLPPVDDVVDSDSWRARIHPDDLRRLAPEYERVLRGQAERVDATYRVRCEDGSWKWIRSRAKVVAHDAAGSPVRIAGVVTDVTSQRRVEAALRESEARFRTLAQSAPLGIFQTDREGNNVFLNPAGEKMVGLTSEQARVSGWATHLHPEDRDRVFREWVEAARTGRDFTSEYRFLPPGGAERWVRGYGSALKDDADATTGYVGFIVDVTEMRAAQAQLQVASRLAALGTLVAGVAHEVNNPLAGALAAGIFAAESLRDLRGRARRGEHVDPGALVAELDDVLEGLADAEVGMQRISRIVKDLVTFGRSDQRKTRIRLSDAVEQAMRWLTASTAGAASIRVENRGAPEVQAALGQMTQVVVNLVTNAAGAMPEGKRGVITVRVEPGPEGTARLVVEDDGSGMTPEVMARIFDPFFTTRAVGQGTGLGLSVTHAIVTEHGGTITVESEAGKGSTFRVELPAAPVEA